MTAKKKTLDRDLTEAEEAHVADLCVKLRDLLTPEQVRSNYRASLGMDGVGGRERLGAMKLITDSLLARPKPEPEGATEPTVIIITDPHTVCPHCHKDAAGNVVQ